MSTEANPGFISKVISSVEAVLRRDADERQAEEQAARAHSESLRHEYLALLCRSDKPRSGDDARLEELAYRDTEF